MWRLEGGLVKTDVSEERVRLHFKKDKSTSDRLMMNVVFYDVAFWGVL
jgi:hypothetical protein